MGDQKRTRAPNSPVPVDPKRRRSSISRIRRKVSISSVPIQRGTEVLMPDWSKDLPEDLSISIAKLVVVDSFEDFIVFGAVCRSWKSAADQLKNNYLINTTDDGLGFLTNQVPLLVIPPSEHEAGLWNHKDDDGMVVKSYSLTKDKTYIHSVPETARKMCYSSLGWLLTLSDPKGRSNCHLVHPLNRTNIQLPDVHFPDADFIRKFVLSSSPSWTLDYVVMCATYKTLQFCRPGLGIDWTHINPKMWIPQLVRPFEISDLLYYKKQFYAVDLMGCVLVCDIDNHETSMVAPEIPIEQLRSRRNITRTYLVESAGVLLVVVCYTDRISISSCRVFDVPFGNDKSWSGSEVKTLGSRTVFLSGRSSSFSIDSSGVSRCKPNCIYFNSSRDWCGLPLKAGILNMEDGTIDQDLIKPFRTEYEEGYRWRSHLWVQLSF